MSETLTEIAEQLKEANKKVQLIYAFNGTGKTRLSIELKNLIDSKDDDEEVENKKPKLLYYNAFTEDLFYWDNDLENDTERKIKIQPNAYTKWLLEVQGEDQNIITNFQRYANDKLTPIFDEHFTEVTFSLERGSDDNIKNIKISKGEESNFIWSTFYTLLQQVIKTLNISDEKLRDTDKFNDLQYVFIDDPVSSLDENHLIELAVNIAELIKKAPDGLKFIITTHNPLFYNVLHNELNGKKCYLLESLDDGNFTLTEKNGDSNQSFSYHLHLKKILEQAIETQSVEKYHFMLLRNLYEKTASFLGYTKWADLLPNETPEDKENYYKRIIQFTSHSTLSNEAIAEPTEIEKKVIKFLLEDLTERYAYNSNKEENNDATN